MMPEDVAKLRELIGGVSGTVKVPAHWVADLLDAAEERDRLRMQQIQAFARRRGRRSNRVRRAEQG